MHADTIPAELPNDPEPEPEHTHSLEDQYAILFPGQGSQSVGMAGKVLHVHPPAADWFKRANDVLDYDLLHLIEHGPPDQLNHTKHSQPAIFVASVAWFEALKDMWAQRNHRLTPAVMGGHSMGQITAMCAAKAADFDDALHLVAKRAEAMSGADALRPGGMASIIGLRDRALRKLLGEASDQGTIVVANDNCPGQTVVSGDEAPLRKLMRLADEHGARRVVRLPISIASHSPLMEGAQTQFREAVHHVNWRDPVVPIVSNISGELLHTKHQLADELADALTKPVRWQTAVKTMAAQGSTLFVEAGPGDVLSKLVRRISRTAWTFPLSHDESGLAQRHYPDKSDGIPK